MSVQRRRIDAFLRLAEEDGTGHNLAQMAEALPAEHPWTEKICELAAVGPQVLAHAAAGAGVRQPRLASRSSSWGRSGGLPSR